MHYTIIYLRIGLTENRYVGAFIELRNETTVRNLLGQSNRCFIFLVVKVTISFLLNRKILRFKTNMRFKTRTFKFLPEFFINKESGRIFASLYFANDFFKSVYTHTLLYVYYLVSRNVIY